jgi:hypothetical protein
VLSDVYGRLGHNGGQTCNHTACYEHSGFIVISIYNRDINFVSHLLARYKGHQLLRTSRLHLPFIDHSVCGKVLRGFACLNPLTPELNPSAQRCLTRFFTGDFAS